MEVWEEGSVERLRTIIRRKIFEKDGIKRLIVRRSDGPKMESGAECSAEQRELARRIRLLNEECDDLRRRMQLSA